MIFVSRQKTEREKRRGRTPKKSNGLERMQTETGLMERKKKIEMLRWEDGHSKGRTKPTVK